MPPEFRSLLKGVLWIVMLAALLPTKADPDLWGNIRFGLDLWQTWSFSTTDPYSFTQDIPWINHNWLPQVVMAVAYAQAGTAGLVLLKVTLVGTALALVARTYQGAAEFVPEAAAAFVLFAALPLVVVVRAQLWTFFGLALLCWMRQPGHDTRMKWTPLLFAVWVNCHIGWIVGLAVLGWWALGQVVRGPSAASARAILITIASVLAILVNPYTWQMWKFLFQVAHLSRDISEWLPLWKGPWLNRIAFSTCAAAMTVAYVRMTPRMPWDRLMPIVGLAYASLRAIKFVDLFVLVSVMSMAPLIVARYPARGVESAPQQRGVRLITAALLVLLMAFTTAQAWPTITCLPADRWRPDATAARALLDARPTGRIVVTFDWGEYVIWHLGPRLRVSYDPRYDLVYSPRVIAEQAGVRSATPEGLAFLQRSQPEYVWFRQSDRDLKNWLLAHGYRMDVDTPESFIAVRADLPPLHTSPSGGFGCFPAP